MKKVMFVAVVTAAVIFSLMYPGRADARVNVTIGVNLPPVAFPGPPTVVFIPGTYVYYVPDIDVDIFFYHGWWYRPYEGRWYRARIYNGPWYFIETVRVPRVVVGVPPGFRQAPPRYKPIPYGQLRRNWRRWERERYWDRRERREFRREKRKRHREERFEHERERY
jgi:hypothetical protein